MGRRAIVVTGTPGTGKTTLSSMLASRLGYRHVEVAKLVADEGLYAYVDRRRGARVVSLGRLRRRLAELIDSSSELLVLSTPVPDVVDRGRASRVIVLRTNPLKLVERLKAKGWPEAKVRENVAAEALGTCLQQAIAHYGDDLVWELDTSESSPEEALEEAIKVVEGRAMRRPRIDWLALAEADDELASLLASL